MSGVDNLKLINQGELFVRSHHSDFGVLVRCDGSGAHRQLACPGALEALVSGSRLVGHVVRPESQDGRGEAALVQVVYAVNLADGHAVWEYQAGAGDGISTVLCANEEAVFFGTAGGCAIALEATTGRTKWRAHLGLRPTGTASLHDDLVVVHDGGTIVGLEAETGRIRWQRTPIAPDVIQDTSLYRGVYFALGRRGRLSILDPTSGCILHDVDLASSLPARLKRLTDFYPLLVSETHIWSGIRDGYVAAFERPGGKYAWHYHPRGAGSFQRQTYFAAVDGVLLYADLSNRLYCLEQVEGGA